MKETEIKRRNKQKASKKKDKTEKGRNRKK